MTAGAEGLVSWGPLATRGLTGSHFPIGSSGVGQDILVYTGRDQGRGPGRADLPLPPVLAGSLEGTWEMDVGVGSGMGREEEVSWLVSSTQQTFLSSTSPVPPTITRLRSTKL